MRLKVFAGVERRGGAKRGNASSKVLAIGLEKRRVSEAEREVVLGEREDLFGQRVRLGAKGFGMGEWRERDWARYSVLGERVL